MLCRQNISLCALLIGRPSYVCTYKLYILYMIYICLHICLYIIYNAHVYIYICRSQWPRGLRCRSAAVRLLRLWVRIPPWAWISVCCECCVLSGRGLCDGLITRPENSYRLRCVVVCDLETSRMRRPWHALGCRAIGQINNICIIYIIYIYIYIYIYQNALLLPIEYFCKKFYLTVIFINIYIQGKDRRWPSADSKIYILTYAFIQRMDVLDLNTSDRNWYMYC